ncbi:hypothetical protein L7F22_037706 [Adiantum nelumboides]|nr:hypothetical protein [Adiantum nelumboides]
MEQPIGFAEPGKEHLVCKLKKSLYGLKQAPREWYRKFDTFMKSQGYMRSETDHCLYTKRMVDGSLLILVLYVDDMLIAKKDKHNVDALKSKLSETFAMKNLGNASHILGMRINLNRSRRLLYLSKQLYVEKDEEPTSQEAILEVTSFDYTRLIQTLSRHFQCQQVVAKETKIQKTRANQVQEENANLRTALELVTKERDSGAKENEKLIRDLMDLQSQLTRKEAQNHELIKNDKKMKEQLKYEDARFQKLNASYNTVKNTLTALLQNQEPAAIAPSTFDSAALNTLAALQAELQTEKLQRQLLVSGFMSQTAQHEARVKQLEEELAKAKAKLAAVGSLTSTSHIQQAETHVPIQPPQLPEMPEFQGTEEEEQQRPAPGALDIREEIEQEIEDLPEGPAKEYLMYEKRVMQSVALAFLQPEEQVKDFGTEFLPLPLMRHEAILWKEKMRPTIPRNEDGSYEGIPLTTEEAKTLIKDHPRWRRKWLSERPRDLTNFHNTPQALQIDPTYCPVPRRRSWAEFQKWKGKNKAHLNYLVFSAQEPPTVNYVVNTLNTTIQLLREIPDIACQMLVKIARMIVTCIQVFKDTEDDDHPWNLFLKGRRGICWNLRDSPPRWIIMALYARLMYLPSHFLQTFEEAFVTGFFEINAQIFHPMAKDLKARYVAYQNTLAENPFRQQQEDIAFATRKQSFLAQVAALEPQRKQKQ